MKKIWFSKAWNDYLCWQSENKQILKRINQLVKDIERNPFRGIGKPEPLKGELSGFWSRRIDSVRRFIYRVNDEFIEIVSCKGHYDS